MAKKSLLRKVWDGLGSVVSFPFKTIGKAVGAIGNKFPGLSRGVKRRSCSWNRIEACR